MEYPANPKDTVNTVSCCTSYEIFNHTHIKLDI